MTATVELHGATAVLGRRTVWRDVSFQAETGDFVALLGPNGAGKSTILRVLLGQLPLAAGEARVLGAAPGRATARVGYLPQRRSFDGHRYGLPLPFGSAARAARARVAEVIERVGARDYAQRPIGELSGGEQQRLLIAQSLAHHPALLLLDEPLDGLDLPNQSAVAALLAGLSRADGVTIVLVAHDVNPLLPYVDRVAYLANGRLAHGSVEEVVTSETLSRLYGAPVEVLVASDGRRVVVGAPDAPAHHVDRHDP